MEVQLYAGQIFPFTAEWYALREHAPHLEQPVHQARMHAVADLAVNALRTFGFQSVVDLGAGDGGTLSLISQATGAEVPMWGYDLQANNVEWAKGVRRQDVRFKDFVDEPIDWGELVIITEVLEHLEDPHGMVRRIGENAQAVIASSPARETVESHDGCHAWCWDLEGYESLLLGGGFDVVEHMAVEGEYDFQVIMGIKP